jgi:hypothetical protein
VNNEVCLCLYCKNTFETRTEHVFPNALGGENTFSDCVCKECNTKFSIIEREFLQKSPVGLIRSSEGLEGYRKSKTKVAPFKAPVLLMRETSTDIIYEVGQYYPFETILRPQILKIGECFYVEAGLQEDISIFQKKFKDWIESNLLVVMSIPSKRENTSYLKFEKRKFNYSYSRNIGKINTKGSIIVDLLEKTHEVYSLLEPRLFLDDNGVLKIRARTLSEAQYFIEYFLGFVSKNIPMNSFSQNSNIAESTVLVGFNWNNKMYNQAVVKLLLNCLVHYFPVSRSQTSLETLISFVMKGAPIIPFGLETSNPLIDNNEATHNIFFFQYSNAVSLRLSLFNGRIVHSLYVSDLVILPQNNYARLLIYYKKRTQLLHR